MGEFGPRGPETIPEIAELLRSPEKAFDSDIESARHEARELAERLEQIGSSSREGERSVFETQETEQHRVPHIQIAWPAKRGSPATMLRLIPHVEGSGIESGVFGYSGEYGNAKKDQDRYEFDGQATSLKELFGVPEELEIIVKPTAVRWAIGKEDDMTSIYGENTRTLYMGLGFLLRGREFMHVGMHEAGHLPENHDENVAWQFANRRYAGLHQGRKSEVLAGTDTGLFDLLKRPDSYGSAPTVGKIMQYGLVSHALADKSVKIPTRWLNSSDDTMREFQDVIAAANEDFEYFVGR